MRFRPLTTTLLILTFLVAPGEVSALHAANVADDHVTLDFPETATFSSTLSSSTTITSVVLEYGNEQLTCGHVIAKAFPQFTAARSVSVEWTWDMRQSGSLPPGAGLWWRWRYTDRSGTEFVSEQQSATWLDNTHHWKSKVRGDDLRLHWYQGDDDFAQTLLAAALAGLAFNESQSGLTADAPIDIYIYANTGDMKDAVLYEPSWTGGLAFPEQDIVILGIPPYDLDWGRAAIIHELTHVLVGHLTFSCLGDVPTWLDEGLAVYSEGELDPGAKLQLDDAIRENTLIPVRSLSGGFSEVSSKANLSYSESYSLVRFLIEKFGQQKMTSLLEALRDGNPIDQALIKVYGFDVDGLEDAWRVTIGADRRPVSAQPTAQPTPTYVPTMVPISGGRLAFTPTPLTIPTSSVSEPTATPLGGGPPLALTLVLVGFCCLMLLLIGVIALGVIVRGQNRAWENDEKR